MQEFIIQFMNQFGYLGICFLIIVENVFPPIPSEIILFFGGFMTTYTRLSILGVITFATLGSATGAMILYEAGSLLTPSRLDALLDTRLVRLLGFEKQDAERTIRWFDAHGRRAILFGRCIPIIRSLISVPAGMAGIKLPVFLVYTVIGSALWNILLVSLGAFFGASWGVILSWFRAYSSATRILLILLAALLCVRFLRKRH